MSSLRKPSPLSRLFGRARPEAASQNETEATGLTEPGIARQSAGPRVPNLIIAGAQKAGTTWLHHTLKKSAHFQESDVKELDFFNQGDFVDRLEEYAAHFPEDSDARYIYESSPNYFRPATAGMNVSANIARTLEAPEVIVLFRDPVDRYLSAYVHHMGAGRFAYAEEIDDVTDDYMMLTRGEYARALDDWLEHLPDTRVYLYDDLADKPALVTRVTNDLRVENDVPTGELEFDVNTAAQKKNKNGWDKTPRLSADARARLADFYAADVDRLQSVIGRDLSHWLDRTS